MNSKDRLLHRVLIEDDIWYIYLFIIGFNLYSNYLEKKYIINNDIEARNRFRFINDIVLSVALLIYVYFLYINIFDYSHLKNSDSKKRKDLTTLALIASILFVIGGAITLYIAINVPDLDIETAI